MITAKKVTVLSYVDDLRDELQNFYTNLQIEYDVCQNSYDIPIIKEEIDSSFIDDFDDSDIDFEYDREEELQASYEARVIEDLENLKVKNFKLYKQIITLFFHDYCIVIHDPNNEYKKDDLELFEEIKHKVNTPEDLLKLLEGNMTFYSDLVAYFLDFTQFDFFEKRSLLQKTNDLDKYVQSIYPLHFLDKLYYTIEYTEDDLKYYILEDGVNAIGIIISLLQGLGKYDQENYGKLFDILMENYYKNCSYKRSIEQLEQFGMDLLTKIETNVEKLKETAKDDIDILESLILELYNETLVYSEDYKNRVGKYYDMHEATIKNKIKKK